MYSIKKQLKNIVRFAIRRIGYDIRKFETGQDAYFDIKGIIGSETSPVIFDVGANLGQTIDVVREYFRTPTIHAFEPSGVAFEKLRQTHAKLPRVYLNNLALGSKTGPKKFFENSSS